MSHERRQYQAQDGHFTLCTELDQTQIALMQERLDHFAEIHSSEEDDGSDDWDEAEAWLDGEDQGEQVGSWGPFAYDPAQEAPCWWFSETGCVGELHCHCEPVTLLEVLTRLPADLRSAALADHMRLMEGLWSHHWSGQGLLEGGSGTIGDACAECIIEGVSHVFDIRDMASALSEELGEALAAFSSQISLGTPRWNPEAA
jgi:hypothetical protein